MKYRLFIHTVLLTLLSAVTSSLWADDQRLTGTVIGTEASVDYNTGAVSSTVNNRECAFDGDIDTYFASYERSRTWVGLDLGEPHVITGVGWSPRNDATYGPVRVQLALFEGANRPDFLDAVPLYLITEQSSIGTLHQAPVTVSRGFRYVRYVGPNNVRCNVAEVAFYGHPGQGDDSQFYQVTNLPTVSIHVQDAQEPYDKVHELTSNIALIYASGSRIQERPGTIRLRGNSSQGFDKKPYRIKFDESLRPLKGSPEAAPAKARKWTLINNHDDKTLMRNILAFEVNRRFGAPYTPWCQAVDVIVNGEYKGCYQFTDQLTVDAHRVNITEMEPSDNEEPNLTGGYLLEMDALAYNEPSRFTSTHGIPVTIHSPQEDQITTAQHNYIQGYFNLMESKVYSANAQDSIQGYRSLIDMESFCQHFLTNEFCANSDMYWSAYLYKDREENQFHIGPVWDFNLGFDNDTRSYPNVNAGDWTYRYVVSYAGTIKNWADRITNDPATEAQLASMWAKVRKAGLFDEASLLAYVDSMAQVLNQSQRLNFIRWPILNTHIFANPQIAGSYEGEVQVVRDFIKGRIQWIDEQLYYGKTPPQSTTYQIGTAQELADFANLVNTGASRHTDAVLTADIDFRGYDVSIGTSSRRFNGTFDGAGHTITVGYKRYSNDAALFGYLGGTVQDLIVRGTITTSAKFAAGIAAHCYGGKVLRCSSYVDIVSSISGDGTHAGIIAVTDGGGTVQNCLYAGSMTGKNTNCCGGLVGWATTSTTIRNCLQIASIQVSESGSHTLSRNFGNVTASGNYYLYPLGETGNAQAVTLAKLSSGQICYQLNQNNPLGSDAWFQTLEQDNHPVPDASHLPILLQDGQYINADLTGISSLRNTLNPQPNIPLYDLTGRPIQNPHRPGVYIRSGRKYIIR